MATGTRRVTDKYKWISAGGGAIEIGTSSVPLNVKTASDPLVQLFTTTALVAGETRSMEIKQVRSTASVSGTDYAFKVTLASEYRTPASASAIYGIVNYGTTGHANGMASAICAEMIVPNMSLERGALYALECEIGGGTSSSWSSAGPVGFIYCGGWGSGVITAMDLGGYLIDIQGFAEGSNKLVDNDGAAITGEGGIRCRVGTTDIWLLYTATQPA